MTMQAIEIMADSSRGQYIPQHFAESCADQWRQSIDQKDIDVLLAGPDDDWYWDTWDRVLNNAQITIDGYVYTLHHDGDLFAICHALLTDEERANLFDDYG